MSNLSEEEIIDKVMMIDQWKVSGDIYTQNELNAIGELLDLYQKEKEKNKELEATLKQTQDSWYEDTKKIELNNECEIALNNRIIDLENELNKEKEKNKKIEEYCRKDFLIF